MCGQVDFAGGKYLCFYLDVQILLLTSCIMQYLLTPMMFQFLIALQGQRREDIRTDEGVNLEAEYENLNCNLQCQENEY